MQKYQSIISGTNGSVIRNVPVTVLKEDGSLAEIFLDREGQVPAPNPLATDSRGVFYFYATNGRYSLRTSVDGITITDADAVLLNDPEEITTAGPIADAVLRAEAAAQRAEEAVEASGIPELVAAAQNAVVDANNAVGQAQAAASLADTAKNESAAAKVAAENAQSGAQSASTQAGQARADAQTAAQAAAQSAASIDPAYLRNRANHTGEQAISTVAGLQDALDLKADISEGATHLSLNQPEAPTAGRLQVFQKDVSPELMPDDQWWSLLRIQHPGYPGGYWQDFAMPFQLGGRPRVRQNTSGAKSAWQELAYTSDVAQAVANLVGTMAGGAIIERGSNANGEYVRFADGTQICTCDVVYENIMTSIVPGLFQSNVSYAVFAAAFTNVPSCSVAFTGSNGESAGWVATYSVTTSNLATFAFCPAATATLRTGSVIAVGRWK
jgi:hypothetical protein